MRRLCVSMRLWTATECLCCSVIKMSDEGSNKNSAVGRLCQWSDDLTPTLSFFFFFLHWNSKSNFICVFRLRSRHSIRNISLFFIFLATPKTVLQTPQKKTTRRGKKNTKMSKFPMVYPNTAKKKSTLAPANYISSSAWFFFFLMNFSITLLPMKASTSKWSVNRCH